MAKTESLAGRTNRVTKERLARMMATLDRTESYLVNQAVERMLDEWEAEQQELAEITQHRDDAEAGRAKLIPHTEVMASWKPTRS